MKVEHLKGDAPQGWQAFVDAAPEGTIYHRAVWGRLIQEQFRHEAHYLLARSEERVTGVLPLVRLKSVLFGDYLVSVPYVNYGGALADDETSRRALLDAAVALARDLNVSHLELRHDRPMQGWPERTDKVAMVRDLPADRDSLLKQLGSKLRSQIRRPAKDGATARHGGAELLDDFYLVFAENMRDLGTPVYPRRFFQAVTRAFENETRLIVVYMEGRPVAAAFLLANRTTLEIPWASSLKAYTRSSPNMLLYAEALGYAVDQGYRQFDFGRSTRGSGTYRFKEQWGARERQLHWHYWLKRGTEVPRMNPDNPKYALAIRAWQRCPLWLTNALGPRIVRNLP